MWKRNKLNTKKDGDERCSTSRINKCEMDEWKDVLWIDGWIDELIWIDR